MNKHTILVNGVFNNLYFWGQGWKDKETAIKWKEYWRNLQSYTWKYKRIDEVDYLISVVNSIFLHPMDFSALLTECGCMVNGSYFNRDIQTLYKICKECAEYCGGTFTMYISEEKNINYTLNEYIEK